ADPAVPCDELEAELAQVARLGLAHLARHEVVVEQAHSSLRGSDAAGEARGEPRGDNRAAEGGGHETNPRLKAVHAGPSLLTSWSFEPLQLVPLAAVACLYARRVRTLRRRGAAPAGWRVWSFGTGVALLFVALASPLDSFGEEQFLSFHMVQHVLLGDLAPLAMVAGLTGPILRPVLSIHWVNRLRVLAHPFVALPLWAVDLYVWHLPPLYQGALHHDAVH